MRRFMFKAGLIGMTTLPIWFTWFFLWRSLVSHLVIFGVEG